MVLITESHGKTSALSARHAKLTVARRTLATFLFDTHKETMREVPNSHITLPKLSYKSSA